MTNWKAGRAVYECLPPAPLPSRCESISSDKKCYACSHRHTGNKDDGTRTVSGRHYNLCSSLLNADACVCLSCADSGLPWVVKHVSMPRVNDDSPSICAGCCGQFCRLRRWYLKFHCDMRHFSDTCANDADIAFSRKKMTTRHLQNLCRFLCGNKVTKTSVHRTCRT